MQPPSTVPTQWCPWAATNFGDPDLYSDPAEGQWLYALKATAAGDRQVVLETGGSSRGIVAVVDFSGLVAKRNNRWYGWGCTTNLPAPISADTLAGDELLRTAFSNRQGGPKNLRPEVAARLVELAGGLPAQRLTFDTPRRHDHFDVWFDRREPEWPLQEAILTKRYVWRALGLRHAPELWGALENGKIPDLRSTPDRVVIEVKNQVREDWGPRQLRGYVDQLNRQAPGNIPWRGVLIHGDFDLSHAARRVLDKVNAGDLSVFSLRQEAFRRWRVSRQL